MEIAIGDSNAFDGLVEDQCRKVRHLVGATPLRLVLREGPNPAMEAGFGGEEGGAIAARVSGRCRAD